MALAAAAALLSLLAVASADMPATLDKASLAKTKIADLKAFLAARGLACDGCSEKADYISLVLDNASAPTLAPTPTQAPPPAAAAARLRV